MAVGGIEKHDLVLVTDNASNMSPAAELGNFLLTVKDYISNEVKILIWILQLHYTILKVL